MTKNLFIIISRYKHISIGNNVLLKLKIHKRRLANSNLCCHLSAADALEAEPTNEFVKYGQSGD